MISYCLKCKNNMENINPKVSKTSNGKTMLLPKCVCAIVKKPRFIKEQEASGLLSSLDIKVPFSKIALLGNGLF